MSEIQIYLVIGVFLIVALAGLSAQFRWLQPGRFSAIVYTLAGVSIALMMWSAEVTLDWFNGDGDGFWLGAGLLVWGLVARTASEKSFQLPFLGGMGTAVLLLNLYEHF